MSMTARPVGRRRRRILALGLGAGSLAVGSLFVCAVAGPAGAHGVGVGGHPTQGARDIGGYFYGASCTSAVDCTAVGWDSASRPIYMTETAGTWGQPTVIGG